MKAIIAAVAVIAIAGLVLINRPSETLNDKVDTQKEFFDYIISFGKQYVDNHEFAKRYANFRKSLEIINLHNIKEHVSYKMGLNQFTDWSQEEIDSFLSLQVDTNEPKNYAPELHTLSGDDDKKDWRDQMNPIKDQGSCGSCWAFSAIGALEASYTIEFGERHDFAEQVLVDCNRGSWIFGNQGCNGGLMNTAFDWLKTNQVSLTADYPYTAKDGTCNKNRKLFGAKVATYYDVKENHGQLKESITKQPVAVAIQANQDCFMKYAGGIIEGCIDKRLDHGIVAVGWGSEDGQSYYIVRNSWGLRWGESGFARISDKDQSCGILQKASYPIAAKA